MFKDKEDRILCKKTKTPKLKYLKKGSLFGETSQFESKSQF
jgi:hypothetical protein